MISEKTDPRDAMWFGSTQISHFEKEGHGMKILKMLQADMSNLIALINLAISRVSSCEESLLDAIVPAQNYCMTFRYI